MDVIQLFQPHNIDQIINDLEHQGFSIINNVHPQHYVNALVKECGANLNCFREAAIQSGLISAIRNDHILWINEELQIAQQHIETLSQLCRQLNQCFYLGLNEVEAHFARYNVGQLYALHRDNPQQKNDRVISTVYYLHQDWHSDWGGELRLQDKNEQWHIIIPHPNRMVIFQSNLLHEVMPAKQQRLSITAWLRRTAALF